MRIDLDAIVPAPLEVKVGGKVYEVNKLAIGDYLKCDKPREEFRIASEGGSLSEQVTTARKLIRALAPEMPKDVIESLDASKLNRLLIILSGYQGGDTGNAGAVEASA